MCRIKARATRGGALSAEVMDDGVEWSLLLESGNCSVITGIEVVDKDCIVDAILDSASTCATAVIFREFLPSFVILCQFFGSECVCEMCEKLKTSRCLQSHEPLPFSLISNISTCYVKTIHKAPWQIFS